MEFYKYREKILLTFRNYRKTTPTTWMLIKSGRLFYSLCTGLIAVQVLLLTMQEYDEGREISFLGIGVFLGFMIFQAAQARLVAHMHWPILEEVLDWDLVEEKCSAIDDARTVP